MGEIESKKKIKFRNVSIITLIKKFINKIIEK
jgi:hypothetical protein